MHIERLDGLTSNKAATLLCQAPDLIWLDSAAGDHPASQYAYLCLNACTRAIVHRSGVTVDGTYQDGAPLDLLRDWFGQHKISHDEALPPFQGGAVGYLSYDFGHGLVDGLEQAGSEDREVLGEFAIYDTLIAFEMNSDRVWLISHGLDTEIGQASQALASTRADAVKTSLASPPSDPQAPALNWQFNGERASFLRKVRAAQHYIREGDIYQANLAERFSAAIEPGQSLFATYLDMRSASPAPFGAFARFSDRTLASTSPERLVSLSANGLATAQPIKGTITRGADPSADMKLQKQLLASQKDRAENLMIVDLLRNDLSRVCAPHTVNTPSLCKLETFTGLHHLTSTVTGQLRAGHDGFDLLAAVFPGGSITGAPKQRAMEIITELEDRPRGTYCGSLGYICFDGALDFNILIRTAEFRAGEVTYATGAGITLPSDPDREFEEIMLKAARITGLALTDAPST
ncbi:MAG: anthranilate synthase component I family protein [Pseudomonadota bacterium]